MIYEEKQRQKKAKETFIVPELPKRKYWLIRRVVAGYEAIKISSKKSLGLKLDPRLWSTENMVAAELWHDRDQWKNNHECFRIIGIEIHPNRTPQRPRMDRDEIEFVVKKT